MPALFAGVHLRISQTRVALRSQKLIIPVRDKTFLVPLMTSEETSKTKTVEIHK